ncbi:thrombospondin type 3 repeat-containing protein [Geoglobus acetivorans]|uniref:thrombospondin type 3 repeat-containing protein n=1 Tax=Geoglobus acetivorans TaxID=565033 RepID=UPI00064EA5A1
MSVWKRWRNVTAVILLVSLLLLAPVDARPEYMKDFKEYSDSIKKCTLCHVQSSGYGGLNSFGADYAKLGKGERLLTKDSDGDGYTNQQELSSGTFPGDPDSKPGKEAPGMEVLAALFAIYLAMLIVRKI